MSILHVNLYSVSQRVTHWLIAGLLLFLMIGPWVIQHSDLDPLWWADWHDMMGQLLMVVLLFRLYLFFTPGASHWRQFIPARGQRHIALQTVKFYASLGRLPCPDWYAYNPLWQPVYLLVYLMLLLICVSGYLLLQQWKLPSVNALGLHAWLADLLLYVSIAHILFSALHDVKGRGGQISAMLSGYKYFHQDGQPSSPAEHSVSVDSLGKLKTPPDPRD